MFKKEYTALIDKRLQDKIISKNRDFMKGYRDDDPYMERFESDQDLKRPQPPLVKPAMAGEQQDCSAQRLFPAFHEKSAG